MEAKQLVVIDFPNRQICDVEYSEEIEGFMVIRRRDKIDYEVIEKSTGKTRLILKQHIHFTTREELVQKINELS